MNRSTNDSVDVSLFFSANEYWALNISLVTIALLGSIQNFSIILAIIHSRNNLLDVPSNWFVLSLAIADAMLSSIAAPLFVFHLRYSLWTFFESPAQLCGLANCTSIFALTLNRFISIHFPFQYTQRVTRQLAKRLSIGHWCVVFALATATKVSELTGIEPLRLIAIIFYPIINTLTVLLNVLMLRKAIEKRKLIEKQQASVLTGYQRNLITEFKSLFRLVLVMGTFCATWIPLVVTVSSVTVTHGRKSRVFQRRFALCFSLLSMNSVIDPLIYFLRSEEFYRFVRKVKRSFFGSCLDRQQLPPKRKKKVTNVSRQYRT